MSLAVCLGFLIYHLFRINKIGIPKDYALPAGSIKAGIRYSFTGAMSPGKKESAYLHLPTYTAGLLYHGGTFLAILLFLITFFNLNFPEWFKYSASGLMLLSSLSGFGILMKRISKSMMRKLSNTDDYLSNFLVSSFQMLTVWLLLVDGTNQMGYYLLASVLLLYIPVGKLKHMIYFFSARIQLGVFYGTRGTWPPKN